MVKGDCKSVKRDPQAQHGACFLLVMLHSGAGSSSPFRSPCLCETVLPCRRYEKLQKGELRQKDVGTVPDVYQRNQHLDQELQFLRAELDKYKEAAL